MLTKKNLKAFINNNFNSAILSGSFQNNELKAKLVLNGEKNQPLSNEYYGIDFDNIIENEKVCCDTLLDYFLENNSISKTIYGSYNIYQGDKYCVDLGSNSKRLTLSFNDKLSKVFPHMVDRIESRKRECAIKCFDEEFNNIKTLKIISLPNIFTSSYFISVQNKKATFNFTPLIVNNDGNRVIYEQDRLLIDKLLEEFLLGEPKLGNALSYSSNGLSYIKCNDKIVCYDDPIIKKIIDKKISNLISKTKVGVKQLKISNF